MWLYVLLFRPTDGTPLDNLKSQCTFIGIICFFLITTYILLVFKRRKRMKLQAEKEIEEAEAEVKDTEAEQQEE